MRVNVVSESEFTVQGHGVHSAFTDTLDALHENSKFTVTVNSLRGGDVNHIHTVGPYSLLVLLFSRGVKIVSAHVMPDSFVGSIVGAKYWYGLAKAYLRWFYNRSDAVFAVSADVVGQLEDMGVKVKIFLMPNTINTGSFRVMRGQREQLRRNFGYKEDDFVVLGSGQVQPRKRIDTFIDVAAKLHDLRFVWVGGVPFKRLAADAASMKRVMDRHPSNVEFTGTIERGRVAEYFGAADLFFFPSAQETFGLVIVEAAASGLPILLRELEGYHASFDGGYVAGDEATFVSIIERFKNDRKFYDTWQSASDSIAERYDAKQGAKRLIKAYKETLAKAT